MSGRPTRYIMTLDDFFGDTEAAWFGCNQDNFNLNSNTRNKTMISFLCKNTIAFVFFATTSIIPTPLVDYILDESLTTPRRLPADFTEHAGSIPAHLGSTARTTFLLSF